MNKLQPKLKKLLKNLLYFVIGILLLISIYDLIRPNTARLTILTSPSDSKIQLNSKSVGSGSYSEILKRGSYEIIVTREGYTQETRDINLTSETNISITLTPSISSSTKTQTVRSVPLESITNTEDNIFYSVDSETGNLIKNDSGKFSTVYQGQVRSYSVQNNTAVILPYDNLSGIIILNTQNNSTRTLDLSLYAPVISVSLSEDGKIIYFLASFGIENKNSILYSIEINSILPPK